MAKDINKKEYSAETKLKLSIFAECFREWFPVFIHNPYTKGIHIFDFFAGSGTDNKGNHGSPLILLEEAKGENKKYCGNIKDKKVFFYYNETKKRKLAELKKTVESHIVQCREINNCSAYCIYQDSITFTDNKFKDFFKESALIQILQDEKYGKFILLDQYGFKEVNEDVFLALVDSPKTDFIFFISSSFIRRFKEIDEVTRYFDTSRINYDESKPKDCHREIAKYFKSLLPEGKEYYLHHYTIQKGKNYYGLIFGSNHTLGMEKFLKACWKNDKLAGESNCNIENDEQEESLFYDPANTSKRLRVKKEIKSKILASEIKDNLTGLKYAMNQGCLPNLFTEIADELIKEEKIEIKGKFNKQATNIHKIDIYRIEAKQ